MPNDRPTTDAGQRGSSWDTGLEEPDPQEWPVWSETPDTVYEYGHSEGNLAEPLFVERGQFEARAQRRLGSGYRTAVAAEEEERGKGLGAWLRRVLALYGWRVYAVPVLAVITVLVIVDAVVPQAGSDRAEAGNASPPTVTEVPATQANLDIPTAELPEGGPVTQRGKGTWHIVPGHGPVVGTSGRLYRYTVEIEDGIDPVQYGGDEAFAAMVDHTLDNPKSWTSTGKVRTQRIDDPNAKPDFRLSLTTPQTDHRKEYCDYQIKYETSCYRSSADRVIISLARWVRGAKAFSGDMFTYRQYAINHEVGHAFGNHHVGCPKPGALAPVMMQQTFGVSNDYVARINEVDPTNKGAVPADHKTCVPNAWPNPEAQSPR